MGSIEVSWGSQVDRCTIGVICASLSVLDSGKIVYGYALMNNRTRLCDDFS